MADYPEYWEADVVLSDGGTAHVRPTGSADTDALREMHARMSARTKYLRYFAAVADVTDRIRAGFQWVTMRSDMDLFMDAGKSLLSTLDEVRTTAAVAK